MFSWGELGVNRPRQVAAARQDDLSLLDSATNTCDSRLTV
jgi:hypothetical protein